MSSNDRAAPNARPQADNRELQCADGPLALRPAQQARESRERESKRGLQRQTNKADKDRERQIEKLQLEPAPRLLEDEPLEALPHAVEPLPPQHRRPFGLRPLPKLNLEDVAPPREHVGRLLEVVPLVARRALLDEPPELVDPLIETN